MSGIQHQFWLTKGTIARSFGAHEDDGVVQYDAELDAKLELFKSLTVTSNQLAQICQVIHDNIRDLAESEADLSLFLKEFCQNETNDTISNILQIVSKAFKICSEKRLISKCPVNRLYFHLVSFQEHAIVDCRQTIKNMKTLRTEYRSTLDWLKHESKNLNPESYRVMEQFRKVQRQVRISKTKYDQAKLNCMQKIDLLAAARCNLFSGCLMFYETEYAKFHENAYEIFANAALKLSQIQTALDNMKAEEVKKIAKPTNESSKQQDLLLDLTSESEEYLPSKLIQNSNLDTFLIPNDSDSSKLTKDPNKNTFSEQLSWLHLFEDFDPLNKTNTSNI